MTKPLRCASHPPPLFFPMLRPLLRLASPACVCACARVCARVALRGRAGRRRTVSSFFRSAALAPKPPSANCQLPTAFPLLPRLQRQAQPLPLRIPPLASLPKRRVFSSTTGRASTTWRGASTHRSISRPAGRRGGRPRSLSRYPTRSTPCCSASSASTSTSGSSAASELLSVTTDGVTFIISLVQDFEGAPSSTAARALPRLERWCARSTISRAAVARSFATLSTLARAWRRGHAE